MMPSMSLKNAPYVHATYQPLPQDAMDVHSPKEHADQQCGHETQCGSHKACHAARRRRLLLFAFIIAAVLLLLGVLGLVYTYGCSGIAEMLGDGVGLIKRQSDGSTSDDDDDDDATADFIYATGIFQFILSLSSSVYLFAWYWPSCLLLGVAGARFKTLSAVRVICARAVVVLVSLSSAILRSSGVRACAVACVGACILTVVKPLVLRRRDHLLICIVFLSVCPASVSAFASAPSPSPTGFSSFAITMSSPSPSSLRCYDPSVFILLAFSPSIISQTLGCSGY
ncbi:hypothetical protein A7U60_g2191 [Sanghuangporus baumii]|uniref:Transmembrane protein n=1 Tax=Sanghuangporus baumii TaxID=108892 RepID=A0A9Q5NE38_SANBA|nr:hypothetical protein A7U60_g2191 [Sanghuangporus baumii]